MKPDRSQHYLRATACVIAQQYFSAAFDFILPSKNSVPF
jgi:hypothetical protein